MALKVALRYLVQDAIASGAIVPCVVDKKRGRGPQVCHLRKLKDSMPHLTPRESELLELLITGRKNAEIAASMGTALSTVKIYVARLLAKCGAKTRTELVVFALAQREIANAPEALAG